MKARDATAGQRKPIAQKPKKKPSRLRTAAGRMAGVGKALQENQLNAPADDFGADHKEAVAIGRQIQQSAQLSKPGRANDIIKRRRV
jgi:hypothetical protein